MNILEYAQKGGAVMYLLLLFSFITLSVIISKLITFRKERISRSSIESLMHAYEHQDRSALSAGISQEDDRASRILALAVGGAPKQLIEIEHAEASEHAERYLHLLQLIGSISPLVGLFGTVLGLARTFFAVSAAGAQVTTSALAGGIWEAMVTTIAGLAVAIPAQLAYHLLISRVDAWSASLALLLGKAVLDDREKLL